jgi:hypothetical protein
MGIQGFKEHFRLHQLWLKNSPEGKRAELDAEGKP